MLFVVSVFQQIFSFGSQIFSETFTLRCKILQIALIALRCAGPYCKIYIFHSGTPEQPEDASSLELSRLCSALEAALRTILDIIVGKKHGISSGNDWQYKTKLISMNDQTNKRVPFIEPCARIETLDNAVWGTHNKFQTPLCWRHSH